MIKLAIDLGSSVTKIYRADGGSGIVLAEPSAVAVDGITGEVKAIGKDAKKLVGKTTEFTEIEFPVYEGEIKNGRLAAEMLTEFLRRVNPDGAAFKKTEVLFALPCGAGDEAKSAYSLLAEECRLKNVYFAEVPYLAALGGEAVLSDSEPVFVMDMGGGNTNIAVLSSEGIIAGLSMNIGGNNMDADIAGRVEKIKSLRVGALTAERLKNEIGSLSPEARGATVAEGINVLQFRPAGVSVQAGEIADCISVYFDKAVEYASYVLKGLPAEVAAAVNKNGLYLSGGVAKLPYAAEYLSRKLEMRVRTCAEPQYAVITGAGALLRDKKLFKNICLSE